MSLLRCPVCRADNSTPPACRRCKADLSLMWQLERQREIVLTQARQAIVSGDASQAQQLLDRVDSLRSGDDSRRLRAACHLLRRDFVAAWKLHPAAVSS